MKTYGGSVDIAPPFLTSALDRGKWSALRSSHSNPGYITDGGWAPEAVWMLWRREKSHAPAGKRTQIRRQSLYRLSYPGTAFK
jgi:hypothetical protein